MILFICGIFKKKGRKEEEKEERSNSGAAGKCPGTRGEGGERQDRLWTRGG